MDINVVQLHSLIPVNGTHESPASATDFLSLTRGLGGLKIERKSSKNKLQAMAGWHHLGVVSNERGEPVNVQYMSYKKLKSKLKAFQCVQTTAKKTKHLMWAL